LHFSHQDPYAVKHPSAGHKIYEAYIFIRSSTCLIIRELLLKTIIIILASSKLLLPPSPPSREPVPLTFSDPTDSSPHLSSYYSTPYRYHVRDFEKSPMLSLWGLVPP
jgi:hypothetical protein